MNNYINQIRNDFPCLQQTVNGHALVYLDNAATSQKPEQVIEAMSNFYRFDNANVHRGVHQLSQRATDHFEKAREKIARFINAKDHHEIVFTRGTTESINLIAESYGKTFLKEGDEIIISEMEHHSNIVPWQMLCEKIGAILKVIPINNNGELILGEYKKLLSNKTKLVSITHISNALGTINPVKEMITLAHEYHAKVIIDGAQAVAHLKVDVQDLDCDFYVFSSHKMFGPTGIGVLYGKKSLLDSMPPYQGGGEMIKMVSFKKTIYHEVPFKFEAGTMPIAEVVGLSAAISYLENLDRKILWQHEKSLLQFLQEELSQFENIKIIGTAKEKCSIVSFVLDDIHAHDIGTILDHYGVAVRTGHHCAMPVMEHFHVPATVRASMSFYNTMEDTQQFIKALKKVKEVMRV